MYRFMFKAARLCFAIGVIGAIFVVPFLIFGYFVDDAPKELTTDTEQVKSQGEGSSNVTGFQDCIDSVEAEYSAALASIGKVQVKTDYTDINLHTGEVNSTEIEFTQPSTEFVESLKVGLEEAYRKKVSECEERFGG